MIICKYSTVLDGFIVLEENNYNLPWRYKHVLEYYPSIRVALSLQCHLCPHLPSKD